MTYALYSFLFTLGVALAAPWYLVRYGRRGVPPGYWRERFGRLPASLGATSTDRGRRAIWVHAVSLGETLAVAGLVRELARRFPDRPIYLSHVTPTGRGAGEARIAGLAGRFYLPLDWKWAVRRVFRRLGPEMLVLTETELWPNLLAVARESGTRVVLVNARLSDRSFRGYRLFKFFFRRVLQAIDWIFAQTERDAERFRQLGAAADKISVAGSLKFDGRPPELGELPGLARRAIQQAGRGPVLVAGSTMAGEERLVLRAWERIRGRFPGALLVLAPRHPQRFEEVAELLGSERRRFLRRTGLDPSELEAQFAGTEILLLNTVGELAGMFELADAAFIGGSLVPAGGHNLLEPAFWAKPVLFGPHMENFRHAADLFLAEGAAFRVETPDELADRTLDLFADAQLRVTVGERAQRLLEREAGATGRIADRLAGWLGERTTVRAAAAGSRVS